jgi:hypothetical protein
MSNCLELTIFSGNRQPSSSIGKALYRIQNGPIFVSKIAVKSCTLYNTQPNVGLTANTMVFSQSGPADSIGRIEVSIPQGDYKGSELATALQTSMNNALTQEDANVAISYDAITRKFQFTFDDLYTYDYSPTDTRYFISSPGFQFIWQYKPNSSTDSPIILTKLVAGNFRLDEWLEYVGQQMTADASVYDADASIRLFTEASNLNVIFETQKPGSTMSIPGTNQTPQNRFIGMDSVGFTRLASYKSLVSFPFTDQRSQPNPIESVLNFAIGGIVQSNSWKSGGSNLSGDLYLHFRSRILANRNHRTVENSRDSTFFSLPITASFTQLQSYEPNERVWINYHGNIELTGFDIELYNEFDQRVEPTSNYVLELLIQQSQVF